MFRFPSAECGKAHVVVCRVQVQLITADERTFSVDNRVCKQTASPLSYPDDVQSHV